MTAHEPGYFFCAWAAARADVAIRGTEASRQPHGDDSTGLRAFADEQAARRHAQERAETDGRMTDVWAAAPAAPASRVAPPVTGGAAARHPCPVAAPGVALVAAYTPGAGWASFPADGYGKRPAAVFDADGTLTSCEWRRPRVEAGDWRGFFDGIPQDAPVPDVVDKLHSVPDGVARVVVSARPAGYRYQTEWMFGEHGVEYDELHMRPAHDTRPDELVKAGILDYLQTRYVVTEVTDDRPQVVAMWRRRGIPTDHVTDPGLPPVTEAGFGAPGGGGCPDGPAGPGAAQ